MIHMAIKQDQTVHQTNNCPLLSHTTQKIITIMSPAFSASSRITRDQPLAHEVGMLSLSNASDPKYLGPSSGVSFARLIYESAPQSQGLPLSYIRERENQREPESSIGRGIRSTLPYEIPTINLPSGAECQQYAEAYFSAMSLYPFILEEAFYAVLNHVQLFAETSTWNFRLPVRLASAQVFLVLSLGAYLLETKLDGDFSSRALFLSGMACCNNVNLHDSIEGVQILLLMVLHSFYSPEGLNAWYLLHTIIASCLDLGLQRRDNGPNVLNTRKPESENIRKMRYLRCAIFWSAYSMDRTLTTILGRPLTLRDEAIDQAFPGMESSDEVEGSATQWNETNQTFLDEVPAAYLGCIYSLRFDRIVAEIKLMIYRVSRSPRRFPWPEDLTAWQQETENSCTSLFREIQNRQRGRSLSVQLLELKYHQCIMLLFRPSPQIPSPSLSATQACLTSAMEIIRIYAELRRFSNMECTWLTAHSIFVAAITVLYCVWTHPTMPGISSKEVCLLLSFLGKWWTVAHEPDQKLSQGTNSIATNITIPNNQDADQVGTSAPTVEEDRFEVSQEGVLRDLFDLGWMSDFNLNSAQPPIWDYSQFMDDLETTDDARLG
ncbi:hypothetical protein BGW36DRAFT_391166 [Talaromyces proteolyticus]|uniref:Xylanolytic transcriptional activator regulatory domain-containing protein n=1 Tax=Talaromyces proteolyticus TaxID=1131652 RepID=A0AAD4PU21_9EURO|nr:uncharacterized protein BGW36DRAFT_391166 [Talaromyces proteolyticus]KAH8689581.1 hypothetical protein BGW36DRAFT_391166 [Talaromyces proteolyticus]